MEVLIPLLVMLLLLVGNGLCVGAEFALIGSPRHQLETQAASGDKRAARVVEILNNPQRQDRFIATAQLGITVASLGLGMYGERTLAAWLMGPASRLGLGESAAHTTALLLTVVLVTYFHVVIGEVVPKSLSLANPTRAIKTLLPWMRLLQTIGYPIVVLLNGAGNWLMRALGVPISEVHGKPYTVEELQIVVEESSEGGLLDEEYADLFGNLLDLPHRTIRQIMKPRTQIVGIPTDLPSDKLMGFIDQNRHTRYPIFDRDLDHIVGVLHIKDVFRRYLEDPAQLIVTDLMQQPLFVPESGSATWLLDRMRERRMLLAVVLDEFGGTAGAVTFEDVLEQVVGEVRDEFDAEEAEPIVAEGDSYRVEGDVLLGKLNEMLGLTLPTEEIDTIGGLVFGQLGRPAEVGDAVEVGGARLEVIALHGRGVARLRLTPIGPTGQPPLSTGAHVR